MVERDGTHCADGPSSCVLDTSNVSNTLDNILANGADTMLRMDNFRAVQSPS